MELKDITRESEKQIVWIMKHKTQIRNTYGK